MSLGPGRTARGFCPLLSIVGGAWWLTVGEVGAVSRGEFVIYLYTHPFPPPPVQPSGGHDGDSDETGLCGSPSLSTAGQVEQCVNMCGPVLVVLSVVGGGLQSLRSRNTREKLTIGLAPL